MTEALPEASDQDRFETATTRLRPELLAYCYRMVGSAHEAEDLVQEVYLRAWRSFAGFEGRASLRSWLYQIATNACLTWLKSRRRRVLPSGLSEPYRGSDRAPTQMASSEVSWLEPLPDAWLAATSDDPSEHVIARESLRLALIASLQYLPPAPRASFILREVLAFSAAETAEILATTIAAVKSGLQRARARLDELGLAPEELLEPSDPRARELLDGYMAAFERSDASLLIRTLRADATLEATPFLDWRAGRVHCIQLLETYILDQPGTWRMLPTAANREPAAAVYRRDGTGALLANGVVVLAATPSGVSRVIAFHHQPALVEMFGFSAVLAE